MLVKMEVVFVVVLALQLLASQGQAQQCGDEIRISPSSQVVTLGGNATITCQHTSSSANALFSWYFLPASVSDSDPSRLLTIDGVHYRVSIHQNMNTLLITNITLEDISTRYLCEKVNEPHCFTDKSNFTLFEKATITISTKLYRMYVRETINITTMVTGNPLPTTITLKKLDQLTGLQVDYPNTKYSVIGLSTISFTAFSLEDSGEYRACVENSHTAIDIGCNNFTIAVKGLILIPPMATVKNGSSLSVTCHVVNPAGDFEMTWQRMRTGDDLANDPTVQVTQLNSTDLRLFAERVTKPAGYSCILRSSGTIIAEHFTVDIIDIPGPPRNLNIQKTADGGIYITWTAPETDNGSPLTAYYVNITVDGANSTIIEVVPSKTDLNNLAGKCKVINVTVTSENACGNSSAMEFSIDTRNQCISSVENSESAEDDSTSNVLPAVGAGVAVVVVFFGLTLMTILIFVIWYRRQKRVMKHSSALHDPESPSNVTVKSNKPAVTSSPPPFIKRNTSIRRYRNMLEVSKDCVTLRDFLQDGTYFELRKALLLLSENDSKAHEVMVKKAKQSAPSEEEHNIQEEIKMMSTVGIHENVVSLIRTCLSESPAYLITEYFAHGDLLGFLRASRGHYGMYTVSPGTGYKTQPCAVQGQDLLKMVTQVAAGMSYLAEKKITHRSLCARNVLVGTGLKVKVYNYGPKADSEATPPNYAKWMAPEMLFDGTANTMSDVWSFAVTSWEIITIGGSPFPTTHPEQMRDLLQSGHRLLKPVHCDTALYSLMDQCWDYDPTKRPTFTALHKQLDTMCKSKLSYLDSSLYNGDEYSQFEETNQLMTAL